jgi:hypothetical protein
MKKFIMMEKRGRKERRRKSEEGVEEGRGGIEGERRMCTKFSDLEYMLLYCTYHCAEYL